MIGELCKLSLKEFFQYLKVKMSQNKKTLCHDLIGSVVSFLVAHKITMPFISGHIFSVMKQSLIYCQTTCALVYCFLPYFTLSSPKRS